MKYVKFQQSGFPVLMYFLFVYIVVFDKYCI